MMKIIYRIISSACSLLAALSVISCTGSEDALSKAEGINITFTTAAVAEAQVRSTPTAGDDDFNENLLNSVYYFLYPAGQTDVAPSVSGFKTGISETGTYQVKVPVSANTVVYDLFATSNECQLFAVANPPATLISALEGKPTLAALRAMSVVSSLSEVPQENFTLVYDGPIEATSLSQKVAVNAVVEMKHLAAKFTLGAIVIPSLTQGTDTYTPDGLSVKLCNGINKTTLGGWNKDVVDGDDYFETDFKTMTNSGAVTVEDETYQKYTLSSPVYSYPMEWEFNSETEPYLMYELNWKITDKDGNTAWKPLYYKLTLGSRSVMQNEWYDISAKLTVLGSLFPEEPTEIYYYMDYLVNGWKNAIPVETGVNTPATIKDTRYLAVNQTEWVLNNKNEVTIPFSSSHDCEVVNKSITTTSYDTGVAASKNPHFTDVDYDLTKPNEITVSHEIYNTLGSGMDCAPIIIEFDLRHIDNASFTEHIKITQNPAILIKTEANSAGGVGGANNCGNTYVNNVSGTNRGWETVLGANSGGPNANNGSTYMVVITVSQFDPDSKYIVADPRNPNIDNLDKNVNSEGVQWNTYNPYSGTAKYHGDGLGTDKTRPILYYHPTIDDTTRDNYVSPCFRVNSANCRRNGNDSYEDSKQRCASFQEDGYPAGRWRLPTLAECELMQTLSTKGMVPKIFIQDGSSKYHYAGGYFTINSNGDGNYRKGDLTTTAAARCVYDEWYWSQVDAKMGWDNSSKTFTWGDVPDDFVIPSN